MGIKWIRLHADPGNVRYADETFSWGIGEYPDGWWVLPMVADDTPIRSGPFESFEAAAAAAELII